jgi:nitrite reductase (NADH) small subunit
MAGAGKVPKGSTMGWVTLCQLVDLAEGRLERIELQEVALCLLRVGTTVLAVEDRCPHRGARLSAGLVYEGCKIACRDHGWTIDLPSGRVEPPESGRVRVFAAEVRDGLVLVALDAEAEGRQ